MFAQDVLQLKAVNCCLQAQHSQGRGCLKERGKSVELGFVSVGCGAQPGNRLGDRGELLSADIHSWFENIMLPKMSWCPAGC